MHGLPFLFIAAFYVLPAPVAVQVYPHITTHDGGIRPRAIIEKHEGNQLLVLTAVRFHVFRERYSEFAIRGAQRQRVFTPTPSNQCICWYDLPAGEYEAVAMLVRLVDGREQIYRDARPFRVMGMEP